MKLYSQQQARITKAELREAIEQVLVEGVPGNDRGPNLAALRKASVALDQIMRLVEQYTG